MLFHIRFSFSFVFSAKLIVLLNVVLDSFISSVFFFFYNFIIFVPNFLQAGNFGVIFTASWLFIDTFLVSEDDEIVSDPLMLFFIGQGMIMECHIPCAFIANGTFNSFTVFPVLCSIHCFLIQSIFYLGCRVMLFVSTFCLIHQADAHFSLSDEVGDLFDIVSTPNLSAKECGYA
ncbi:hypothetical protein S83_069026 [Arachis hypogaea]